MMKRWILLVGLGTAFLQSVEADDWPQWRGPDRSGVSQETNLLKQWPQNGPRRIWLYDKAGNGYSGPAIVGGRLFTMGTRSIAGKEQEAVIALEENTGKELWTARIGDAFTESHGDGPRGTPTVDGGLIFALGSKGTLVCVRSEDGSEVWRTSLTDDLGGKMPGWAYSESVLVDGDQVICTPGGSRGALAALDRKTGKEIWRSKEFTAGAQYSSPILVTHNGVRQAVRGAHSD